MRIRIRYPHKTKRKKVKDYGDFNIEGRRDEVKRCLVKKHPVEYGPCDLCGSAEGKLHIGEPCHFICDRCGNVEDMAWYDVPKPVPGSLGKRILRECELIFRGLCTKCAPRHASR